MACEVACEAACEVACEVACEIACEVACEEAFMSILQMSISAGVLVIAIVLIRAVVLNRLPKKMFLILWGIALCRLLVPVSIPARFSIYSIIGEIFIKKYPDIAVPIITVDGSKVGITGAAGLAEQVNITAQTFYIGPTTAIWLWGMLSLFIIFAVIYFRNHRGIRFATEIRDNDFFNEWLTEHKLLRPITIMQSDRIISPLAVGIFKPRIILPKSMNTSDKQLLDYVLTHEYYHIKRHDALWKMLLLLALCVHWFNPMVWIMVILATRDLELTCDEAVICRFGAKTKKAYAYMIIGMAEQGDRIAPLYSGFSKNATEERITSIMKTRKTSIAAIIVALLLVVGVTMAFATSAKENANTEKPDSLMALYDENGDLVWHQSLDENGNIVYLDYEPEPKYGDLHIVGLEDFEHGFFNKTVSCVNRTSGEHKVENGEVAIYTNNGDTWDLKGGQTVSMTFDVTDKDWWGVFVGYGKDGEYILCNYNPDLAADQRHIISGRTTVELTVPEDGEYSFFMQNFSAGAVVVKNCTISVQ